MGVTEDIVRFIDEASFEALPDEVVFRTKTLIADAIGTMLAGSVEDGSRILQNYLMRAESRKDATVVGAGFKGCGTAAALANVTRGAGLAILSCAPPGQGGHHHVNERPRRYWVAVLRTLSRSSASFFSSEAEPGRAMARIAR